MSTSLNLDGLEEKNYCAGDTILAEGQTSDNVYVLKSGTLKISRAGIEICKTDKTNTMFGEMSVLLSSELTATVSADTAATVYIISDLKAYLQGNSDAALQISTTLAERLQAMNDHFVEIKNELGSAEGSGGGALQNIIRSMDMFWGTVIVGPDTDSE
ncbi:MAG: cyclic nucleotide-binding domain-containing protein [Lentisphaeria bacterium]|nr:cyclic nucleotide-binding domain-containing protein [Lentisphaeria bacterium]NQZ68554.1 cyclic nucleotide-binding domain-containing protein [Lentisphaeria bacterium]